MSLVRIASCVSVLSMFVLAGCPSDPVCDTGSTQVCVCPSLAMGAQTCTAESVWGTCVCGDPIPDGGISDASIGDASIAADTGPDCMTLDTPLATSLVQADEGSLRVFASSADGSLLLATDVYFGIGAMVGSSTVALTDENYATCAHCVVLRTECAPSGTCGATYLATRGSLEFVSLTTISMDAVLTDAHLIEVTIDPKTFESTPVGSRSYCIDRIEIQATTCGDAECRGSETTENCPADCS